MRRSRRTVAILTAVALGGAGLVSATSALGASTGQDGSAAALGLHCAAYPGGDRICSGEVKSFDGSPLDVDVTEPGAGTGTGHPLIVLLHGFGNNKHEWESTTDSGDGADKYDWNSHWFAGHGYYVLTYTARGFTDSGASRSDEPNTPSGTDPSCPKGGSACAPAGTIRVKNKDVEIRDTQWLAANVAHAFPGVDTSRVAVSGGSYGGGESWQQAAEPVWSFPHTRDPALPVLQLQVAVPKYPWTDLAYSLVPNGHPGADGSIYDSAQGRQNSLGEGNPFGVGKTSYVTGLYALGTTNGTFEEGQNAGPQTDGPEPFTAWLARVAAGEPYDAPGRVDDPTVATIRHDFSGWHSAFYQPGWAAQRAAGHETAVLSISGWTDNLFPPVESFRMYDYLKHLDPLWPVAVDVGDVGHSLAQNPPAVWRRFNDDAWRFLQANIAGAHRQATTVTSEPTLCAGDNAGSTDTANPADAVSARSPATLASGSLDVAVRTPATLAPTSGTGDPNSTTTDPILKPEVTPTADCPTSTQPSTGFTAYSAPLPHHATLVDVGYTQVDYTALGAPALPSAVLAERLWDVAPNGTAYLISRGVYRFDFNGYDAPAGRVKVPFFGNHFLLQVGHRLRLDLQQVDTPMFKAPTPAVTATLELTHIQVHFGTREAETLVLPGA